MSSRTLNKRFHALDLLRGFFIVIIIVDHLSRWPNAFEYLSGRALLWVTAAEGFVIISGLLVGYVRGYKAVTESLRNVTLKLWQRALTLYIWAVLGSILYTAAIWYLPLAGGAPGMPIEKGEWGQLIVDSLNLSYTFLWVYFLKLYALFLAISPLAIWLLRKGKAWLVALLSLAAFSIGFPLHNEVLQWQIIFFAAIIIGFYMNVIQEWWQGIKKAKRHAIASVIISVTVATIILSTISTYLPEVSSFLDRASTTTFAKDKMSLMRALLAFVWFAGFLFIFMYLEKYIEKAFGWVLRPIGTHSLTAYIIHGVAIIAISAFTIASENFITNTLLSILAVTLVWATLKIPGINKVIPR